MTSKRDGETRNGRSTEAFLQGKRMKDRDVSQGARDWQLDPLRDHDRADCHRWRARWRRLSGWCPAPDVGHGRAQRYARRTCTSSAPHCRVVCEWAGIPLRAGVATSRHSRGADCRDTPVGARGCLPRRARPEEITSTAAARLLPRRRHILPASGAATARCSCRTRNNGRAVDDAVWPGALLVTARSRLGAGLTRSSTCRHGGLISNAERATVKPRRHPCHCRG